MVEAMSSDNFDVSKNENKEDIEEGEIDFSSLTSEEKDALILEMQAEEMMQSQKESAVKGSTIKVRMKKKRRKQKKTSKANVAPGLGWVAIKMGSAMTFSLTFVFLGPLLIFMALFKGFSDRSVYDWFDLLWGCIGIGLTITAYFLFRYIIKD